MPRRGLIIAIEHYADLEEGLAGNLDGTHQSALDFRRWLIEEHAVAPGDIVFCAEDPALPERTAGATKPELEAELDRLRAAGFNQTEQLYCYIAGHGFTYEDGDNQRIADVLLLQDYRRRTVSGNACVRLDELRTWLMGALGPGDHYYFVDCCRNRVGTAEISVGQLGLSRVTGSSGAPKTYTLYSTIDGSVAAVESGFSRQLIDGLNGTGRAKEWREDDAAMQVRFDPLSDYVRRQLEQAAQEIDTYTWGGGKGVIRELVPPPRYALDVLVVNADPADEYTLEIRTRRGQPPWRTTFTGGRWSTSEWPPDAYQLSVSLPGHTVEARDPLPADLYGPCTIRFEKRAAGGQEALPAVEPDTAVAIRAPANASVRLVSLTRGQEVERGSVIETNLAPDRYRVDVLDHRNVTVRSQRLTVTPGPQQEVDLGAFEQSPLRDAILGRIPHENGSVDFSETLGGLTPDQGLDGWLAVIGAARILQRAPDAYSKLSPLPLATFFDVAPDAGPLYVLAGFDEPPAQVTVGLDRTRETLPLHPELPGLFEFAGRDLAPGCRPVTLEVDEQAPLTVMTSTLPNRATLLVVARSGDGVMRVRQLVLPLPHLVGLLPRRPEQPWHEALPIVRRSVEIQRQFARGRELASLLTDFELSELLFLKWFEPISCLFGAYELARRGRQDQLGVAVANLERYFPELPDTSAIKKLAGREDAVRPADPPLILDGLLAWDLLEGRLPLPAGALDFTGPWTSWRGGLQT